MQKQDKNPYKYTISEIEVDNKVYHYFSLKALQDKRIDKLPYSIRVLLECALRNCDNFNILRSDVENIINWTENYKKQIEVPFKPARVILQDFTGVPLIVDLAAMRDAISKSGGDPKKINPLCPVDLVIDHSITVEFSKTADSQQKNEELEFYNNKERFEFLKWGQSAFENLKIVPPGSGIVHQVNLEYLARSVFYKDGYLYPDSVVGTDSHTTMINGLGVLGWGVGGIEAEAVMLGECTAMVLPEVVGFKLTGSLPKTSTATDLVLTVTEMLRKRKVVGKFVEFFGPGCCALTLADRATIANMAPEYGATTGYFPVDQTAINFLRQTGRDNKFVNVIEAYLKANNLFRNYDGSQPDPIFSGDILTLDLSTVVPSLAGPKRPMDRVELKKLKNEFLENLTQPIDNKSYGLTAEKAKHTFGYEFQGEKFTFKQGTIVLAAITSCTNTSNPGVMLAAGMLAKNAVERGLKVPKFVKTSLSPGSQIVSKYYQESGFQKYLDELGFNVCGYGCMTCIGNSGDIDAQLNKIITEQDFVAVSVLSGNRNFEARVHPNIRANYLASPPLVVAFALAGNITIDFETESLGKDKNGKDVFLRDIWPSREDVEKLAAQIIKPEMFINTYNQIAKGTDSWNKIQVNPGFTFKWNPSSTYIHEPPFFKNKNFKSLDEVKNIKDAYVLGLFGDSITTDHISPAGKIAQNSPAGRYLIERGVQPKDFNQYGTRRGNDEIMARGTFANSRIVNKLLGGAVGPNTIFHPTGETLAFFDASQKYIQSNQQQIVLGGLEYGTGSSRDWAAKGPYLLGVSAVIAQSFERIHRSNLIGMGILPMEFLEGENSEKLGLTGKEKFTVDLKKGKLYVGEKLVVTTDSGKQFTVKCRLDTDVEINYFNNGGILIFVLRKLINQ